MYPIAQACIQSSAHLDEMAQAPRHNTNQYPAVLHNQVTKACLAAAAKSERQQLINLSGKKDFVQSYWKPDLKTQIGMVSLLCDTFAQVEQCIESESSFDRRQSLLYCFFAHPQIYVCSFHLVESGGCEKAACIPSADMTECSLLRRAGHQRRSPHECVYIRCYMSIRSGTMTRELRGDPVGKPYVSDGVEAMTSNSEVLYHSTAKPYPSFYSEQHDN
jgi:hypothetical protein